MLTTVSGTVGGQLRQVSLYIIKYNKLIYTYIYIIKYNKLIYTYINLYIIKYNKLTGPARRQIKNTDCIYSYHKDGLHDNYKNKMILAHFIINNILAHVTSLRRLSYAILQ
jgi:hypothetical protein